MTPLIEIPIEAQSRADDEALLSALSDLAAVDGRFVVLRRADDTPALGVTDEAQADRLIAALTRQYDLKLNVGAPQVAYREKVTKAVEKDYTHKKQTGGTGQFARVKFIIEPNETGKGFEFESKIIGGAVPKEYFPGVVKGLESVLGAGVVAGFPVVDLKVALIDGAYHEADSSALAFEIASRAALREALREGNSVLLEPIMRVEVVTDERVVSRIIRDVEMRRGGSVSLLREASPVVTVRALVPLANMFGYGNWLRAADNSATYRLSFVSYEIVDAVNSPPDPPFTPAAALRAARC